MFRTRRPGVVLLTTLASVLMSACTMGIVGGVNPTADPSLSVSGGGSSVGVEGLMTRTGVVYTDNRLVLMWNASSTSFVVVRDGEFLSDVVTYTNNRGLPAFAALDTDGTVQIDGAVDPIETTVWSVDISASDDLPIRADIFELSPGDLVISAQTCDCKDGIGLSCTTRDCDNKASCSAGTSTCAWSSAFFSW